MGIIIKPLVTEKMTAITDKLNRFGVVVPKGGLLNLLRYVADCGGKMKIESLPQYVLSIELPSKNGEIEKE